MKDGKHPELTETNFRCQNCGTEHHIRSALPQSDLAIETCAVCVRGIEPGRRVPGNRIDKFRLRQARARRAQEAK